MNEAPARVELYARPRGRAIGAGRSSFSVGPREVAATGAAGGLGQGRDAAAFVAAICLLLLHRHSGQAEVALGLCEPSAFGEGTQRTLRAAFAAAVPLEEIRAAVRAELERGPGDASGPGADAANVVLAVDSSLADSVRGQSELAIEVRTSHDVAHAALTVRLDHDATVDAGWAREFAEQFFVLAEQAAAAPDRAADEFSLVTESARAVLPDPARALEQPAQTPIADTILAWGVRTPQAVAVVFDGRDFSYATLAASARAMAQALSLRGAKPGDVVAVAGRRSFGLVGAMVGVLQAGGVLLMLDPKLPLQRRLSMIEQGGAAFIVAVGEQQDILATPQVAALPMLRCGPDGRFADGFADAGARIDGAGAGAAVEAWTPPTLGPDAPAYVFFTSGSTGTPKAVKGRHAGLAHFLAWQRTTFGVGPGDRASQLTALSFDVILRDTFLSLGAGATLCIPDEDAVLDPARILHWLEAEAISIVHIVPSLARLWLDHVPPDVALARLRRVFFAGEPLTDVLVQRWRAAFPGRAEIVNLYGPTETTLAKCFRRVPEPADPGVQPVGATLPQTQALILDKRRRPCGLNEPGEIVIRTPFRTAGYLGNPTANAAAFIPNPWRDDADDLLYLTGDSGRWCSDGLLEIRGRIDNQVKIRGVRIEPAEIEACLARHPQVAASIVMAREDAGGEKFLAAYVVAKAAGPEGTDALTIESCRAFLRERLPETMVPSAFVKLVALPLNPNGKVDKKALPAPDLAARSGAPYRAPEGDVERRLASAWAALLGLDRVGVDDSFFDIGGHSLLAVQLVRVMQEELGLDCSLPDLFRAPTIRGLSVLLGQERDAGAAVIALQEGGTATPVFCICGIHLYQALANRLGPEIPVYGIFLPSEQAFLDRSDADPASLPSVEEMAADYVRALRVTQPTGPYRLLGVSFGGVLAYEVAQQLRASGESVTFLAMLDSMLPRALRRDWVRWAFEHARRARLGGGRELGHRLLNRLGLRRRPDVEPEIAVDENARLGALRQSIYAAATRRYAPRPYAGAALLVRATDAGFFQSDIADKTYGWGGLAPALQVRDAQGDHLSILAPPHVDGLAAVLRLELERSERAAHPDQPASLADLPIEAAQSAG